MSQQPAQPEQTPVKTKPKKTNKKSSKRWPLLVLFIVVLLLLGVGFYFKHHQGKAVVVPASKPVATTPVNQPSNQVAALQQQVAQLQATQTRLLAEFAKHGFSNEQLALNNARYLLRQANLKLTVEHDPATALALLGMAQQRIGRFNSIALDKLNKAIAVDAARLKAIKPLNTKALVHVISVINQQVAKLSIFMPHAHQQQVVTDAKGWREHLQKSLASLKDVVVVERTDTSFIPLLSQQQVALFKQYLMSLYSQALWAALHHDAVVYHDSLQQAKQAVQQHMLTTSAAGKTLLHLTEQLQKMSVTVARYPALTSLPVAEDLQLTPTKPIKATKAKVAV